MLGGPAFRMVTKGESVDPSLLKTTILNLKYWPTESAGKLVMVCCRRIGLLRMAGSLSELTSMKVSPPWPSSLYMAKPVSGQPPLSRGSPQARLSWLD